MAIRLTDARVSKILQLRCNSIRPTSILTDKDGCFFKIAAMTGKYVLRCELCAASPSATKPEGPASTNVLRVALGPKVSSSNRSLHTSCVDRHRVCVRGQIAGLELEFFLCVECTEDGAYLLSKELIQFYRAEMTSIGSDLPIFTLVA